MLAYNNKLTQTILTDQQQNTQSSVLALHIITAACDAVINTQFTPPDVKPTWFDDGSVVIPAAVHAKALYPCKSKNKRWKSVSVLKTP